MNNPNPTLEVLTRARLTKKHILEVLHELRVASRRSKALNVPAAIESHQVAEEQKLVAVQHIIDTARVRLALIASQREGAKVPVPGQSKESADEKTRVAMLRQRADSCMPGTAVCKLDKEEYEHAERRLWINTHMTKLVGTAEKKKQAAYIAAQFARSQESQAAALQAQAAEVEAKDPDGVEVADLNTRAKDAETASWNALAEAAKANTEAQKAADAVKNSETLQHVTSAAAMPLQEELFELYTTREPGTANEIVRLSAQLKKLQETGERVYRSMEEQQVTETADMALKELPSGMVALRAQIKKLRAKADETMDTEYQDTLTESAFVAESELEALKAKEAAHQSAVSLTKQKAAVEQDRQHLAGEKSELQSKVDSLQTRMGVKLHGMHKSLLIRLREPQQEKWESLAIAGDGARGLELIVELDKKRSEALISASHLLAPEMSQIRDLYAHAMQSLNQAARERAMDKAEDIWNEAEATRTTMLKTYPVDTLMLSEMQQEIAQDEGTKDQLDAQVDFLKSKIDQLNAVIAEERSKATAAGSAAMASATAELNGELLRDRKKLAKKEDAQFFATKRIGFTKEKRFGVLQAESVPRMDSRAADEAAKEAILKVNHQEVMDDVKSMWSKETVLEAEETGLHIEETIKLAAAKLTPVDSEITDETVSPAAVVVNSTHTITVKVPNIPDKVTKSPLDWEQTLHDASVDDVQHVNSKLEGELDAARHTIAEHGGVADQSAVDRIESKSDEDFEDEMQEDGELDCRKYPLLCKVGKEEVVVNATAQGPPPAFKPDPVEIAGRVVNIQGEKVATAQKALGDLLMDPNADAAREQELRRELAKQQHIADKAERYLAKLEAKREENNTRNDMKEAKLMVDALLLKLQRLGKQEPPPQKTITKYTIRLQTAQEVFNDKHSVYVTLLDNMREHAEKLHEQYDTHVKELETELAGVPLGANLTLPSGRTKDTAQSLLKAIVQKSAEQVKEIQRIDEAKDAAGKSTIEKTEFYTPTEAETEEMDKVQEKKMRQAITQITHMVLRPQGEHDDKQLRR